MKTLIVAVLDESGSMGPKKNDVIGGFNVFLDDQKKIKNDIARLHLIKFNTVVNPVHVGVPLDQVPQLNDMTYTPGGGTALYDAVAHAVMLADRDKKQDERVLCVVMTDGEENSSRETTKEQVKSLMSGREARDDWTFLYIGENPEQWARDTGIQPRHATSYDHQEVHRNFAMLSKASSKIRSSSASKGTNLFD